MCEWRIFLSCAFVISFGFVLLPVSQRVALTDVDYERVTCTSGFLLRKLRSAFQPQISSSEPFHHRA